MHHGISLDSICYNGSVVIVVDNSHLIKTACVSTEDVDEDLIPYLPPESFKSDEPKYSKQADVY